MAKSQRASHPNAIPEEVQRMLNQPNHWSKLQVPTPSSGTKKKEKAASASSGEIGKGNSGSFLAEKTVIRYNKDGLSTDYQVLRPLSEGGFAKTYLVRQAGVDMPKVLKEFFPYKEGRRTDNRVVYDRQLPGMEEAEIGFIKEPNRVMRLLLKSQQEVSVDSLTPAEISSWQDYHLAIPVTEAFKTNGTWYYIMEYVPGETLFNYLERLSAERCMGLPLALEVMDQLCIAVNKLHEGGVIHQDISPNNVMVSVTEAKGVEVKLIDFGMSTLIRPQGESGVRFSRSHVKIGGTVCFCDSEENLLRFDELAADKRTADESKKIDVYALGKVLAYLAFIGYHNRKDNTLYAMETAVQLIHQNKMNDFFRPEEQDSDEVKLHKLQMCMVADVVRAATSPIIEHRMARVTELQEALRIIRALDWVQVSQWSAGAGKIPAGEALHSGLVSLQVSRQEKESATPEPSRSVAVPERKSVPEKPERKSVPEKPEKKPQQPEPPKKPAQEPGGGEGKGKTKWIVAAIALLAVAVGGFVWRSAGSEPPEGTTTVSIQPESSLETPVVEATGSAAEQLTEEMHRAYSDEGLAKEFLGKVADGAKVFLRRDADFEVELNLLVADLFSVGNQEYRIGTTHQVVDVTTEGGWITSITIEKMD